jgi:hypothetical protein
MFSPHLPCAGAWRAGTNEAFSSHVHRWNRKQILTESSKSWAIYQNISNSIQHLDTKSGIEQCSIIFWQNLATADYCSLCRSPCGPSGKDRQSPASSLPAGAPGAIPDDWGEPNFQATSAQSRDVLCASLDVIGCHVMSKVVPCLQIMFCHGLSCSWCWAPNQIVSNRKISYSFYNMNITWIRFGCVRLVPRLFHCLGQALTQSPAPGHRKTIQCHLQAEKQGKIWIRTCNYASTKTS